MNIASQFVKKTPGKSAPRAEKKLDLSLIRVDGGTQSREEINQTVIDEYAADIKEVPFPPVIVFYDGEAYWLADGFHRYHAHKAAGLKKINVEVNQGTRRDAILYSVGANAVHGLRRTNDDKRRGVQTLLSDAEWSKWSDHEIARRCAVSREYVNRIRPTVTCDQVTSERTYINKHGTVSKMDTSTIGKPDQAARTDIQPLAHVREVIPPNLGASAAEQQAEHNRQREQHAAALPQAIKDHEAAKAEAIAARKAKPIDVEALTAELEELREANTALEAELAKMKADNAKWEAMRVQYEQGGFEKVIAGKDEEIRVLKTRVSSESQEKVRNLNSFNWAMKKLTELGFSRNAEIDIETGEVLNG